MKRTEQQLAEIFESMFAIKRGILSMQRLKLSSAPFTIPPGQMGVVFALEQFQPLTVKEVAQKLAISSSAATQLVDILVEKGVILRSPHPSDRRKVCLTLSPKITKEMRQVKGRATEHMRNVFGVLSDAEFAQYLRLTRKVVEALPDKGSMRFPL